MGRKSSKEAGNESSEDTARINIVIKKISLERLKNFAKSIGVSLSTFLKVAAELFIWALAKKEEGKRIVARDTQGNEEEFFLPFSKE